MNILDVDINDLKYMKKNINISKLPDDKLERMFIIQDKLREMFGVEVPKSLDTASGQKVVRDMSYNVIQEMCEAINLFKNHEWTKDEKRLDIHHFKEEIGDMVLFLIEFLLLCNIGPEEMYQIYLKIAEKNFFRLETKY